MWRAQRILTAFRAIEQNLYEFTGSIKGYYLPEWFDENHEAHNDRNAYRIFRQGDVCYGPVIIDSSRFEKDYYTVVTDTSRTIYFDEYPPVRKVVS